MNVPKFEDATYEELEKLLTMTKDLRIYGESLMFMLDWVNGAGDPRTNFYPSPNFNWPNSVDTIEGIINWFKDSPPDER